MCVTNHHERQQAKQADRLDQKVMIGLRCNSVFFPAIVHSSPYLVDSTHLKPRQTDTRNGITLKRALVGGRYDKLVPTNALESRIA